MREGDISTYHDALMRWAIIPQGEGAKGGKLGAIRGGGEGISAYRRRGAKGALSFGISSGKRDKNGAGWNVNEASIGQQYAMP